METETFDIVIIGAGSAGCALAGRLSESGQYSVALLEAGPKDANPWIHLPIGYAKTMWNKRLNWSYYTEPDDNMLGRKIYWPRGKVLGGCSSINGLIAIRGQKEDYDHWRDLGNPGWSYQDVLPYFIRLENNDLLESGLLHGKSGPLPVTSIKARHELIEMVIAASEKLGLRRTADFNGHNQEGAGYYQLTIRNGLRCSAAKAYLKPAAKRQNLRVVTGAQATRVLFDGHRATGVACRVDGVETVFQARRMVVLSAGALQSPQLLMLSGIGPGTELAKHAIPVLADRPSVGRNLQDHLQIRLIYRMRRPITTNDQLRTWFGQIKLGMQWMLTRSGPLAVGINQGGIFVRVLPESATPDVQFHVATLSADMAGGKPHPFSGCTLSVCQLRPESRGEVRLASADPFAAPLIYSNYLSSEADRRCVTAAIAFARRLAATEPLKGEIAEEFLPGPKAVNDTDLLHFAQEYGATIFHPSGTCRMGSDDAAVVDSRLRVRGVEGLRVVDCSIMPTLVSGNTNLPAIMIAEKASDIIKEDLK
ncbi:MAG TPA: GMC family oxidoreductase N-terminal domain-containing protein [Candidatus Sulfotelmatobacter sp.]|nr:GMC family oxidoreductase N-terminal domain-containing protein [Candidatus Sulfotelmatobacter sp.]